MQIGIVIASRTAPQRRDAATAVGRIPEANPSQRTYRYTQFCQKYKDWAKSIKRSMRQQHRAGEKLFADFAGPAVPILARDGGVEFEAHVFVAVLGASYAHTRIMRSKSSGPRIIGSPPRTTGHIQSASKNLSSAFGGR